jgi:hypothetical protein
VRTDRICIPFSAEGEGFDLRIHHFGRHQISVNESTSGRFWWMAATYVRDLPDSLVEKHSGGLRDWRLLGGGQAKSGGEARRAGIRLIRAWVRSRKEGRACG